MDSTKDLIDRIARLQAEAADVQAELAALKAMKPDEQLAMELHYLMCRKEHISGEDCTWDFEVVNDKPDWSKWTHQQYLAKAKAALSISQDKTVLKSDTILAVLKTVQ